jgi:DNA-binding transcriptional LysR family regulator
VSLKAKPELLMIAVGWLDLADWNERSGLSSQHQSSATSRPKISQEAPNTSGNRLCYIAAGLGISLVLVSMRQTQIHGLSYRRIAGPLQPKLPLNLASRRSDASAVVRQFRSLVIRSAKKYPAFGRSSIEST